jgi:hypothetical protein
MVFKTERGFLTEERLHDRQDLVHHRRFLRLRPGVC